MATLKSATIAQGFTDTTQNGSPSYIVTRRVAFDTTYDVSEYSDLQTVKAAALGNCWSLLTTGSDTHELGRMRLRTSTVTPVPGTAGKVFDVTGRYDSMYTWTPLKTVNAAYASKLALPVEIEVDSQPRTVAAHRSPSFTTNPAADSSTTTDIGGTKIDYGGKPTQVLIPSVRFKVSLIFDCSRTDTSATLVSLYDRVSTHQGRWNSAAFMHWASANQVYCESANISHVRDEYYRVSYVFVWDQWYGAEQVPKVDVNGNSSVDSNGSAATVTWKNIVRGSVDHNLIFNDQPDSALAKQIALEGSWLTYP